MPVAGAGGGDTGLGRRSEPFKLFHKVPGAGAVRLGCDDDWFAAVDGGFQPGRRPVEARPDPGHHGQSIRPGMKHANTEASRHDAISTRETAVRPEREGTPDSLSLGLIVTPGQGRADDRARRGLLPSRAAGRTFPPGP